MAAAELKWREGKYGGAQTLTLAEGFIRIYVGYALTGNYFEATVNDTRLTFKFTDAEKAKKAALRVAFKLTGLAHEQIKNFLEV